MSPVDVKGLPELYNSKESRNQLEVVLRADNMTFDKYNNYIEPILELNSNQETSVVQSVARPVTLTKSSECQEEEVESVRSLMIVP